MARKLTIPQRFELARLVKRPRSSWTWDGARTRVQNKLVDLGLARFTHEGQPASIIENAKHVPGMSKWGFHDSCEITDLGREALKNG